MKTFSLLKQTILQKSENLYFGLFENYLLVSIY